MSQSSFNTMVGCVRQCCLYNGPHESVGCDHDDDDGGVSTSRRSNYIGDSRILALISICIGRMEECCWRCAFAKS
jgi:hypothetical protein